MRVVRHRGAVDGRPSVATLGIFDGVHVAHREILRRVVSDAASAGLRSAAVTFHPHPATVLGAEAPGAITSLRSRLRSFREIGIETVRLQRFTAELAQTSAAAFVEDFLVRDLAVRRVVIGHKVGFGRGREGDAEFLRSAGERLGFDVEVLGAVRVGERAVSSTAIRRHLAAGEVAIAGELLGRPYALEGRVVRGMERGRTIGFPTANLATWVEPLVPSGVYAVRCRVAGDWRPGVCNIGTNPTFGDIRGRSVETHLLDFEGDLYGQRMELALVEQLRAEVRFDSVDELVEQIARDADAARRILR